MNGFLPFIKIDLITVVIDSMADSNWAHRWPIMNGGCSQNTNDDQCPNKMESLSMFDLRGYNWGLASRKERVGVVVCKVIKGQLRVNGMETS